MNRCALFLGFVVLASCGGSGGGGDAGTAAGMCGHPASLDDAGVGACHIGRAALFCESASQGGCDCVTDAATCGCSIPCENKCHANEYAAACGGPPMFQGDGGATYADPPAACRSVGSFPSGGSFYCCPCQ